jgi:hypothetical protein
MSEVQVRTYEDFREFLMEVASNAYVEGCRIGWRDECRGADAKMERGIFGRKEFDSHKAMQEKMGLHFGLHAAIREFESLPVPEAQTVRAEVQRSET